MRSASVALRLSLYAFIARQRGFVAFLLLLEGFGKGRYSGDAFSAARAVAIFGFGLGAKEMLAVCRIRRGVKSAGGSRG